MSLLSTFSARRKAELNYAAVNGFCDTILLSIVSLSGLLIAGFIAGSSQKKKMEQGNFSEA
jgi:hypothetical protein